MTLKLRYTLDNSTDPTTANDWLNNQRYQSQLRQRSNPTASITVATASHLALDEGDGVVEIPEDRLSHSHSHQPRTVGVYAKFFERIHTSAPFSLLIDPSSSALSTQLFSPAEIRAITDSGTAVQNDITTEVQQYLNRIKQGEVTQTLLSASDVAPLLDWVAATHPETWTIDDVQSSLAWDTAATKRVHTLLDNRGVIRHDRNSTDPWTFELADIHPLSQTLPELSAALKTPVRTLQFNHTPEKASKIATESSIGKNDLRLTALTCPKERAIILETLLQYYPDRLSILRLKELLPNRTPENTDLRGSIRALQDLGLIERNEDRYGLTDRADSVAVDQLLLYYNTAHPDATPSVVPPSATNQQDNDRYTA